MSKKYKNTFIKNIYYMLAYAFMPLRRDEYDSVAAEEFDNLHNLLAAILVEGIGKQLKQGLYREYVSVSEDLTVIRGKIDLPATLQNRVSRKRVVACDYDELSANNLLNSILKTTANLLLRHSDVDKEFKDKLKNEMLFFGDIDTVDPRSIKWERIRFQRSNDSYRMLMGLCQLVIEGLLVTTEAGEYRVDSFVEEKYLNRLYEKFILEYYRKEWSELSASASQIPWALDDDNNGLLPVMQSDIMLSKESTVLIIDAKYYSHTTQTQYDKHTVHSHNIYQIFTYVKNKDARFGEEPHTVSGMLLYAGTDEDVRPDETYRMSGNKISVRTLDLDCDFISIREQLNAIAEEHFAS